MASLTDHPFFAAFPGTMPSVPLSQEEGEPEVAVVIPARMGSTRFPGKPLAQVNGVPLIIHVARMAQKSDVVDQVIIATDAEEIAAAAEQFGFEGVMTSSGAHTGSDRVAEVAKRLSAQIIVNLQADEVIGDSRIIGQAVLPLLRDDRLPMSTLRRSFSDPREILNTNIVKVVCNQRNLALYFSRSPIPMDRDGIGSERPDLKWDQHLGIYAFRKPALLEFARLPVSSLEELEKLEQLRALDYGFAIYVARTEYPSWRVDTPDDLEALAKSLRGPVQPS